MKNSLNVGFIQKDVGLCRIGLRKRERRILNCEFCVILIKFDLHFPL